MLLVRAHLHRLDLRRRLLPVVLMATTTPVGLLLAALMAQVATGRQLIPTHRLEMDMVVVAVTVAMESSLNSRG
jgi:nitrate reductase gamma subunit